MDQAPQHEDYLITIQSCDQDVTLREGDWLRLWSGLGIGVAHDVWVGSGGTVYENSGPGGNVRRNTLANVLAGRLVIQIVGRTAPADFQAKLAFAESMLGTPWSGFYNCQDFASEVATGKPQSFQREAAIALSLVFGGLIWLSDQGAPRKRRGTATV